MSNNQDQINSKDFLIGTLIGGIVGASIALLWAPKSGKELRSDLNEQAQIAREKGGQLAETAKIKTTDLLDKVRNQGCSEDNMLQETVESEEANMEAAVEEVAATETATTIESTDNNEEIK